MGDLIVIQPKQIGNEKINSVDARDLHSRLGLQKKFSDWIKQNIVRLNLVENVDYLTVPQKGKGGKFDTIDYILTLDAGKHIAMMTNTDTAHDIRTYFIEFEKRAKAGVIIQDPQTRALIQLLSDHDAMKQAQQAIQIEQSKQSEKLNHVASRLDAITPRLTSSAINTIQGAISHVAKVYREAQKTKHVHLSVAESTEYFRLLIHDKFNVADIGYLSDIKAACKFLQSEAKRYQAIINDWYSRNNLFGGTQ